jgi:hypothetical protein
MLSSKKIILPQNSFSAEQSAIIGAIQSERNNRNEIVIITDYLSTIMAAESRTPTKNPMCLVRHKQSERWWIMKDRELPFYGSSVTREYQVTKKALDEDISTTERYPPDDLKKPKMEQRNNEMKERKPYVNRKEDTK